MYIRYYHTFIRCVVDPEVDDGERSHGREEKE